MKTKQNKTENTKQDKIKDNVNKTENTKQSKTMI